MSLHITQQQQRHEFDAKKFYGARTKPSPHSHTKSHAEKMIDLDLIGWEARSRGDWGRVIWVYVNLVCGSIGVCTVGRWYLPASTQKHHEKGMKTQSKITCAKPRWPRLLTIRKNREKGGWGIQQVVFFYFLLIWWTIRWATIRISLLLGKFWKRIATRKL
jgi:hypothetical protein